VPGHVPSTALPTRGSADFAQTSGLDPCRGPKLIADPPNRDLGRVDAKTSRPSVPSGLIPAAIALGIDSTPSLGSLAVVRSLADRSLAWLYSIRQQRSSRQPETLPANSRLRPCGLLISRAGRQTQNLRPAGIRSLRKRLGSVAPSANNPGVRWAGEGSPPESARLASRVSSAQPACDPFPVIRVARVWSWIVGGSVPTAVQGKRACRGRIPGVPAAVQGNSA
jgi:hypothetical protein